MKNLLSLHYFIRQPLGWEVKLTPIRQLSSIVLNLYQTIATDIK